MIKINMEDSLKSELLNLHENDCYEKMLDWFRNVNNIKHTVLSNENVKEILKSEKEGLNEWIVYFNREMPNYVWLEKDKPYQRFRNRNWGLKLLEMLNVRVCPYCNRQYTITASKVKISPHYDHFYPKSRYPFLQLSLFNLIPSCSTCNVKKGDSDPYQSSVCDIFYPYKDVAADNISFQTKLGPNRDFRHWLGFRGTEFTLQLIAKESTYAQKTLATNEIFGLEEVYQYHLDYVSDVIQKVNIYSKININKYIQEFPEIFEDEVTFKRLFFMNELEESNLGNRPLAKLTKDIYDEFSSD